MIVRSVLFLSYQFPVFKSFGTDLFEMQNPIPYPEQNIDVKWPVLLESWSLEGVLMG
jgi:hypothetical protein